MMPTGTIFNFRTSLASTSGRLSLYIAAVAAAVGPASGDDNGVSMSSNQFRKSASASQVCRRVGYILLLDQHLHRDR